MVTLSILINQFICLFDDPVHPSVRSSKLSKLSISVSFINDIIIKCVFLYYCDLFSTFIGVDLYTYIYFNALFTKFYLVMAFVHQEKFNIVVGFKYC